MLIALTVPEVRRLLLAFTLTRPTTPDHVLAWSYFRRRRQWQARVSHYHRRGQIPP
ncbi:hypothetical protein SAMN05421812_1431 [Asanoa hainanensis]|uniref:Uncharacterized protein n=1 Tax=Asanoa hainanensis TaxID=560556 RepID=A0A239P7N9_9ACTN|nr:hypothetical protein SAMN05421812_109324 [Asanoa hainanensis]SNT63035.1 hypothetical protein SAMN05421812_114266 [Asanoa hainanensis]SNT64290.1 hypothetical protein SAMN05421812_116186 [Asanoa hainanensis]SNT66330.1 hypothetical protein SAMN05421812_1431 [Asanoa hainanensis]